MLTLQCTPKRDSANTEPQKDLSFSIYKNCLEITLSGHYAEDRDIILSEEDTKQLLKLLKFELDN